MLDCRCCAPSQCCRCCRGTSLPGLNATAGVCATGQYSVAGARLCSACPLGRYGNATGLTTAQCSGACTVTAGGYCHDGATSPSGVSCPVGKFNNGTTAMPFTCADCPQGRYGSTKGLQVSITPVSDAVVAVMMGFPAMEVRSCEFYHYGDVWEVVCKDVTRRALNASCILVTFAARAFLEEI